MVPPPRDPWYRRYYGYTNRPYTGCGCLYSLLILLFIWWLLSWLFYVPFPFYVR